MSELQIKFGKLLEMERVRRELKLEDLAAQLKISESNLASIEAGETSALPAELYYNLFARSYAELLGIDYFKTVEAIEEDIAEASSQNDIADTAGANNTESEESDDSPQKHRDDVDEEGTRFGRKVIFLAAGVIVIFIAFLVGYKFFFDGEPDQNQSDFPVESLQSNMESGSGVSENQPAAVYDWSIPGYTEPDSLLLSVTARDVSWATIRADGDTVIYQNLTPGRTYRIAAKYRLLISIGIPRLVDVRLNGEPVGLAHPESGRISMVEINQANVSEFGPPLPRPIRRAPVKTAPPAENESSLDQNNHSQAEVSDSI